MSDSLNLDSSDRNSADATNVGHKSNQDYDNDHLKVEHLKPVAAAPKPKPKPKPRISPEDTSTVLKSSDDLPNREKGNTSSQVTEVGTTSQMTYLMDCLSTVTVSEGHVPSPPPDHENIVDEDEPVIENVACIKEVKGPVQIDSETSDYKSDSRGSIDDDVMLAACSVANGKMALSEETCASRREVCLRNDRLLLVRLHVMQCTV